MLRVLRFAVVILPFLGACEKKRTEPPLKKEATSVGRAPAGAPGSTVKPIPAGFHTVTASLVVRGAAKAIEFYKRALGAEAMDQMPTPDGKAIVHAALKLGDSYLFLADEMPMPGANHVAPETTQGKYTIGLWLYVPDVDSAMKRAIDAGATQLQPPTEMFWGDRFGRIRDPFGHEWAIATHKRDLSPEEIKKGAAAFFEKMAQKRKP